MPVDAELTTDRDITIDTTGDISTVYGRENIRQQHVNAAFRAAERFESQLLNANAEKDFEILLRSELNDIGYVKRITRLEVNSSERRTLNVIVETNATEDPVETEVSV